MLLQDNKERQVILEKDVLSKQPSITIYNKATGKKRTYNNRDMVCKLFASMHRQYIVR